MSLPWARVVSGAGLLVASALAGCAGGTPGTLMPDSALVTGPPRIGPPCDPCLRPESLGPAARATLGSNPNPEPIASDGGPRFGRGGIDDVRFQGSDSFPLKQSVLEMTQRGSASDALNTAGATISVLDAQRMRLTIPALNIDVVTGGGAVVAMGDGRRLRLTFASYDYLSTGSWELSIPGYTSHFLIGYRTAPSALPATGSAGFAGDVAGSVFVPGRASAVTGRVQLEADFAAGRIDGTLTEMRAGGEPWNAVSFTASLRAGSSDFSGSTAVTSAPPGPVTLGAAATGFLDGGFYGPGANAAGAIWTLHDGTSTALGTFDARR